MQKRKINFNGMYERGDKKKLKICILKMQYCI